VASINESSGRTPRSFFSGPLDRRDADRLTEVLKALAGPTRIRLLSLIYLRDGEANVVELTRRMDLAQPTVSHHLQRLARAGSARARAGRRRGVLPAGAR
jgi:DNA-binding transcriptional ArsR family regulator